MFNLKPNFFLNLTQDEFEVEEEDLKDLELGRGNRMRKETNYDDQLSERDWLKAIGVRETFRHLKISLADFVIFKGGRGRLGGRQ